MQAPVNGGKSLHGEILISDAISILGSLFRGQGAPRCHGTCDVDADQEIIISDPIQLLTFLFLSGRSLPSSGPFACGITAKASCERSLCTP